MNLPILRTVSSMRQHRSTLPSPVSLVPTMGMLHAGHISLVRLAARQTPSVIVSIYVNPTQLRAGEDQKSYPSTLSEDVAALQNIGKKLEDEGLGKLYGVFAPTDHEMYPYPQSTDIVSGIGTFVNVAPLARILEGADQPMHFVGVATVCLKLFNAIKPDKAYFGEKDCQQALLIQRLVRDLLLDIDVVVGRTIREEDGLALSSRNVYLGRRRRKVASILYRALSAAENIYRKGNTSRADLISACIVTANACQQTQGQKELCDQANIEVIYFHLSHPESMEDLEDVDPQVGAIVSGAVWMLPLQATSGGETLGWRKDSDKVRLIDNIRLYPASHQLTLSRTAE